MTTLSGDVRLPDAITAVITDPSAYADGRINNAYKWMQQNNPVGKAEPPGFDPFWVITRYADIQQVALNNEVFHSGDLPAQLLDRAAAQVIREQNEGRQNTVGSVVAMDPPDRMKYRTLTAAWFLPGNIKKREDEFRAIARVFVDKMAAMNGRCDFCKDIALYYPLRVIMNILGVPEHDEPLLLRLTQEMFGVQDPDVANDHTSASAAEHGKRLQENVAMFTEFFTKLGEERRRNPRDDLATVIATAEIDGKPIGPWEEIGYYITVATAGHDTTSSSTSVAMWQLAKNPEQFAKAKADPSLIPGLVEEAIRYAAPIKHFMRSAARDAEIGGRQIKAGDWLMLCFPAGNLDPEAFPDADSFLSDRKPNKHLSFGHGPHMCLGQHLARMEMRILFEELLPRLKWVELDGEPKLTKAWFISGPRSVPIRYEMT